MRIDEMPYVDPFEELENAWEEVEIVDDSYEDLYDLPVKGYGRDHKKTKSREMRMDGKGFVNVVRAVHTKRRLKVSED